MMMKRFLILMAAALLLPSAAMAQSARATASPPVHDEGTVRPLSQTLSGALRVTNPSTGATAQQAQGNIASATADSGNPVKTGCVFLTAPTSVATGQRVDNRCTAQGYSFVVEAADATNLSGVAPVVSSAVSGGIVGKASAGNLYGYNVVAGASAGFVLITNTATVPADGAVAPLRCIPLAANTGIDVNLRGQPVYFSTGISVSFSTTGCFTKTASATAFIAVDAR
jgi:hypothetical protein